MQVILIKKGCQRPEYKKNVLRRKGESKDDYLRRLRSLYQDRVKRPPRKRKMTPEEIEIEERINEILKRKPIKVGRNKSIRLMSEKEKEDDILNFQRILIEHYHPKFRKNVLRRKEESKNDHLRRLRQAYHRVKRPLRQRKRKRKTNTTHGQGTQLPGNEELDEDNFLAPFQGGAIDGDIFSNSKVLSDRPPSPFLGFDNLDLESLGSLEEKTQLVPPPPPLSTNVLSDFHGQETQSHESRARVSYIYSEELPTFTIAPPPHPLSRNVRPLPHVRKRKSVKKMTTGEIEGKINEILKKRRALSAEQKNELGGGQHIGKMSEEKKEVITLNLQVILMKSYKRSGFKKNVLRREGESKDDHLCRLREAY